MGKASIALSVRLMAKRIVSSTAIMPIGAVLRTSTILVTRCSRFTITDDNQNKSKTLPRFTMGFEIH
jgi:hypothetical protein